MTTAYHAKYFAHELTRKRQPQGLDRLSMALFDASVDLNPHQIDAAAFALRSPLSKGVLLADEVGLGKTIEAGLVLCQYWAERKRRLLVICPAGIRKQWAMELLEKFNLPCTILDAKTYRQEQAAGNMQPFACHGVVITSLNFASRMQIEIAAIPFDLAVIDEAHKLRNAYRPGNKMGQAIKSALQDRKKLLLTATPLQNSLLELYGLAGILDETIFPDLNSFRAQYVNPPGDQKALRQCLQGFCQRTLRRQVVEYIQYTQRRPMTFQFTPTDNEHNLYEAVSHYLMREGTFALPQRQRHLTTLILRKLLASSSIALANTLETLRARLELLQHGSAPPDDLAESLVAEEQLEGGLLDEILDAPEDSPSQTKEENPSAPAVPDGRALQAEIAELARYAQWARSIGTDTKSRALLKALENGLAEMDRMGARRKALVFTESRRTQDYLKTFLESNGYAGQIVLFNGTNASMESGRIIDQWLKANVESGRVTGSRAIDSRTALVEYFRDHATVMLATEAAAEGVNLQFCSLVVNYDLPWNPQRIEQRIGRCHRYGQKHDVVVINFLNERNEADRRVQELLAEKFNLFSGVFGASDEVLGAIESGVDFERRVLQICQQCRTHDQIAAAFQQLRQEMEDVIAAREADTRRVLLEEFDSDVHARLKTSLHHAQLNLDHISRLFWQLTTFVLTDRAVFDNTALTFTLNNPPTDRIRSGLYHLISKKQENVAGDFLYRLSHPLGEWTIDSGKTGQTPLGAVTFNLTGHSTKLSMVEALKGQSGFLVLEQLTIDSFEQEEQLLFSAVTAAGESLDQEACEKLFQCSAQVSPVEAPSPQLLDRLEKEADRHTHAAVGASLEANSRLFAHERERLENWADNMVAGVEQELFDIKSRIRAATRQARLAPTLDEQSRIQQTIRDLEATKRKQRQEIFAAEDQIMERRDQLIEALHRRMSQKTSRTRRFMIRWEVV